MARRAILEKVDQQETDFYQTANKTMREALEVKEMARELRKRYGPKVVPVAPSGRPYYPLKE